MKNVSAPLELPFNSRFQLYCGLNVNLCNEILSMISMHFICFARSIYYYKMNLDDSNLAWKNGEYLPQTLNLSNNELIIREIVNNARIYNKI